MTESSGYNDPGSYDAAAVAAAYDRIVKTGYQQGFLNSLAVSQNTPTAMNVLVATGGAWVKGIWYLNPAIKTMTIEAADTNLDRVDLIVVRRSATTKTELAVLKGTNMTAGTATAPTLTKNIATTYEIPLASVLVAHGTSAITIAMISDLRLSADCGPVACEMGFFTIDPETGNLVCASKRIAGLADPSGNQDAETKSHVAGLIAALNQPPAPGGTGNTGKSIIVNTAGTGYEVNGIQNVVASASDTLQKSVDTEQSGPTSPDVTDGNGNTCQVISFSNVIQIPITHKSGGIYRVSFEFHATASHAFTPSAQLYCNGKPWGTKRTQGNNDTVWYPYSEDLTLPGPGGAHICIGMATNVLGYGGSVKNFRIYCTETYTTAGTGW